MKPIRPTGRGTGQRPPPRFLPTAVEPFDDGWGQVDARPRPATTVSRERTRTAITHNQSPDVPFSASLNPYKGCEHGCVYCFARPTHAYLDLSPGLDFETMLVAKPDAPEVLRAELSRPGYRVEPIAIGANTDAYQPIERELQITRRVLEVLCEFGHPASVITKSNLILRDLDLYAALAERGLVHALISVTTLDRELARRLEPRAPAPERRLAAIRGLADAGVPVSVLVAPVIPAINDGEIEAILEAGRAAGARAAATALVRLPLELKELFEAWLEEHAPARKGKVLGLLRDARGGKLYDATWGERMRGTGPYARLLEQRFELGRRRLGLADALPPLVLDRFAVSPRPGQQLRLL
jgi:DNA repair photolyase